MNASARHKRRRVVAIFALALPLVAGGQVAGEGEVSEPPVSLAAVLAHPDAFEGREIALVGYVSLGFEEQAIWLMPSDYENSVLASSVGLDGPKITTLSVNGYAKVSGVFHKRARSHDPRTGNIVPRYVEPWPSAKMAQPAPASPPRRGCSWFF